MTATNAGDARAAASSALPVAASAAAAGSALVIRGLATGNQWPIDRLVVVAWLLITIGVALGSSRLVTTAAVPALGAAMLGLWPSSGSAWGSALVMGCLWYATTELAWAAVAAGGGTSASRAVARNRVREVATVLVITVVGGTGAALIGQVAPERTLVVQLLASVLILAALTGLLLHLGRDGPSPGSGVGGDHQGG